MNSEFAPSKSILIINEDRELVTDFTARCQAVGLVVVSARNARDASLVFDRGLPDLLMFDIELMAGNDKKFIDCLAAYEDTRNIPSILLCEEPEWDPACVNDTTVGYRVHKCLENWWRIEMFIFELIDLDPSLQGNNSSAN